LQSSRDARIAEQNVRGSLSSVVSETQATEQVATPSRSTRRAQADSSTVLP
jgi:hypothetical protein